MAIVTLDSPEAANAVDRPTADELTAAFRRFDADDAPAVPILTGAGGRICARADLKEIEHIAASDPLRVQRCCNLPGHPVPRLADGATRALVATRDRARASM